MSSKYYNKRFLFSDSESVKLNGKCPETLFRCARGLILLPPPFRNVARAKELIDKGFRVAAYSRFGNQVMAEYYKTTVNLLYNVIFHDLIIFLPIFQLTHFIVDFPARL